MSASSRTLRRTLKAHSTPGSRADAAPVLYRTPPTTRDRYTGTVQKKGNIDAGLARIRHLEEQLARTRVRSGRHREFAKAIRIEAGLYRKSLDNAQAARRFAARPALPVTGRASRLGVPMKSRGLQ